MKTNLKLISLLSAAVLLLSACSNSENVDSDEQSGSSFETSSQTESGSTGDSQTESGSTGSSSGSASSTSSTNPLPLDKPNAAYLPKMDGSTSAIPLEVGLVGGYLGVPYNEAERFVSHTTTHESFKRLISGEVDLIFSVPISDEQQKLADDAGVKLFMEPIAREGFVFAVNAENPVDSLTSEQLRKIYSGEITNWSQVGGRDETIIPYQRNTDSGSQNYMTVFMGDTPLLEPKSDYIKGGMAGIMDAVAVYDNSAGAIGYSVYSYAAQMYANANKVKFIAVDGVAPSKATMADESYPLLSCTYAIYTDKSPASAKSFVELATSERGQSYVLESGYLPVNGMDVPEKYLPYEAVGTGIPRPADADFSKCSILFATSASSDGPIAAGSYGAVKVIFLKDKELQNRINAEIADAAKRVDPYGSVYSDVICRNGYLSVAMTKQVPTVRETYTKAETLTYDLFTGKRIERFSDLFFEGEDFVPAVNERIGKVLSLQAEFPYYYNIENIPKLDFSGLLGEQRLFTINSIGFEPDNLYLAYGQFIEYSDPYEFALSDLACVASRYRDMKEIAEDKWADRIYDDSCNNEWITEYVDEGGDIYFKIVGSPTHTDAEVKAADEFWHELQRRYLEQMRKWSPDFYSGAKRYGEEKNYYYIGNVTYDADSDFCANFDRDTLELITINDLVEGDWRQYLNEQDQFYADFNMIYPSYWYKWGNDEYVTVLAYPDKPLAPEKGWWSAYLYVPVDKINKRYFTQE